MSFGPWFPLTDVGIDQHAPEGPAAVQVKREAGLLPYPAGKSAMVFYFYAELSAADAIQSVFHDEIARSGVRGHGPLRFRVWEGLPAQASLEILFSEFVERFGSPPLFHTTPPPDDAADDAADENAPDALAESEPAGVVPAPAAVGLSETDASPSVAPTTTKAEP